MCFDNVFPYDLSSVITQISHWMEFWSALQRGELRGAQIRGARLMLLVLAEIFSKKRGWAPLVLHIAG